MAQGKRQSDKQRVGNRCVEGREVKCLLYEERDLDSIYSYSDLIYTTL